MESRRREKGEGQQEAPPFLLGVEEFRRKKREREQGARKNNPFSLFERLSVSFSGCVFCLFFLSPLLTMADLADFISFSSVEALNENPEHSFQNALKKVRNESDSTVDFEAIDRWLSRRPSRPSRKLSFSLRPFPLSSVSHPRLIKTTNQPNRDTARTQASSSSPTRTSSC